MRRVFIGIVVVVILGAVAYGLYLTGSPASQRQVRFDERRVSDLQQISRAVRTYHEQIEVLPQSLGELERLDFLFSSTVDPETGEPYEYRTTGKSTYELCAVFTTDSSLSPSVSPRFPGLESWEHGIGRQCFSKEVLVKAQRN